MGIIGMYCEIVFGVKRFLTRFSDNPLHLRRLHKNPAVTNCPAGSIYAKCPLRRCRCLPGHGHKGTRWLRRVAVSTERPRVKGVDARVCGANRMPNLARSPDWGGRCRIVRVSRALLGVAPRGHVDSTPRLTASSCLKATAQRLWPVHRSADGSALISKRIGGRTWPDMIGSNTTGWTGRWIESAQWLSAGGRYDFERFGFPGLDRRGPLDRATGTAQGIASGGCERGATAAVGRYVPRLLLGKRSSVARRGVLITGWPQMAHRPRRAFERSRRCAQL